MYDQGCTPEMDFISLEKDLFLPIVLYMGHRDIIPIIFDSDCSVAVTPCKKEFQGTLVNTNKTMQGPEVST